MAVVVPFLIQAAVSIAASYAISKLFGPKPQNTEGPKLEDRRIQSSTYGASIPLVFGTYRTTGTVIWGTDFAEEAVQSSGGGGGKGGPSGGTNTEYNYYANFAVQICEGPINGIRRVWADGRLIHSPAYSSLDLPFARVYPGDETQQPDPFIQTVQGVGKTPAYRGTCYLVFERWPVKDYGNRIPNLSFEVERSIDTTVGSAGSPANPFTGSLVVAESSSPAFLRSPSPSNGAALYVAGTGGLSIVAAETANATGQWGFELAVHTPGAWANGATRRYSGLGGVNAPARIWPGQSSGRRVVFEQVGAGGTYLRSVFIGSAGTTAAAQPAESFTLPAAFVGPASLSNFSLTAATGLDRLKCIVDPIRHVTYLVAASHLGNSGGILASAAGSAGYMYDYRPLFAAGYRLVDACFNSVGITTVERLPSGSCVLRTFNTAGNQVSSEPMPPGPDDWRIHRRGPLLYAVAVGTGNIYMSLSGRWCNMGSIAALDASTEQFGQGRNFSWEIFRAGWQLTRYNMTPSAGFTQLPGLGGVYPLENIIRELCLRVGIAGLQFSNVPNKVRGFIVPRPMTVRAALETICHAHFVEGVESDGQVKFYGLNQPVQMDIPDQDLDARAYGTPPKQLMTLVRAQEVELPKRVTLVYSSFNGPLYDNQEAECHAQRLATKAVQEERQDMPISFKLREAQPIAECHLRRAWLARTTAEFTTQTGSINQAYTLLEPGDLVTSRGYTLRIIDKLEAKGTIQWKAVVDDPSIYPLITASGGTEIETIDPPDEANEPNDTGAVDVDVNPDAGSDFDQPTDAPSDFIDVLTDVDFIDVLADVDFIDVLADADVDTDFIDVFADADVDTTPPPDDTPPDDTPPDDTPPDDTPPDDTPPDDTPPDDTPPDDTPPDDSPPDDNPPPPPSDSDSAPPPSDSSGGDQ